MSTIQNTAHTDSVQHTVFHLYIVVSFHTKDNWSSLNIACVLDVDGRIRYNLVRSKISKLLYTIVPYTKNEYSLPLHLGFKIRDFQICLWLQHLPFKSKVTFAQHDVMNQQDTYESVILPRSNAFKVVWLTNSDTYLHHHSLFDNYR